MLDGVALNAWNTHNAYMWFSNMIDTYDSSNLEDLMFKEFDKHLKNDDNSLNEFMLHLLKKADLNISNFNYEKIDSSPFVLSSKFKGVEKEFLEQHRIITTHQVI